MPYNTIFDHIINNIKITFNVDHVTSFPGGGPWCRDDLLVVHGQTSAHEGQTPRHTGNLVDLIV